MIRRPPRSTRVRSSAASDVYKRQTSGRSYWYTMKADALALTPCVAVSAGGCGGHFRWFKRPRSGDSPYFLRLFPLVPHPTQYSQPWQTSERPYWDTMKADVTLAFRAILASDLSESDGPHYASFIARTASPSKSSLNTLSKAIITATQALSTLMIHRAVDAQQPKHRPLHSSLATATVMSLRRSVTLTEAA